MITNLDIEVWRKVFGGCYESNKFITHDGMCVNTQRVQYSSMISCAWAVVNKMRHLGYKFYFADSVTQPHTYVCYFFKPRKNKTNSPYQFIESTSETKAICLAALSALRNDRS